MRFGRHARLLCVLPALLAGCAGAPERSADIVLRDALQGGSALTVSQDSTRVAGGSSSGEVRIWDIGDGRPRGGWKHHAGPVNGLFFVEHDRELVSTGYDGRILRSDSRGRVLGERQAGSPVTAAAIDRVHGQLLTGHRDGRVVLWDLPGLRQAAEWTLHGDAIRAVAFDTPGQRLAASDRGSRVAVWRRDGPIRELERPPSDARALAFSPRDGRLYGSGWFQLFRWEAGSGRLDVLSTDHHGAISGIAFAPDGRLATISRQTDSAVLILDPADGRTLQRLARHELCGVAVRVTPDGRHLATTSDDASVRIWHLPPPAPPR